MLLGPLVATLTDALLRRSRARSEREADDFGDARGSVLVIGFGRFGQIVSQCLLAEGIDVTTIDNDPDMIQTAGRFGFKVYYGDGTRLDVLRAAGAGRGRDRGLRRRPRDARRIVDLVTSNSPAPSSTCARSTAAHTLQLIAKGVDYELRETLESALGFGASARALGLDAERAAAVADSCAGAISTGSPCSRPAVFSSGTDVWFRKPQPEPLVLPSRRARGINPEAETIIREAERKKAEGAGSASS